MLRIKGLYKKYDSVLALNGLNMEVPRGEIYGFVGPNGAGKTTTIKIIAGLLNFSAGEIWFDDKLVNNNMKALQRDIGYLPDSFGMYDNLTVNEYLEFYASAYGLYGNDTRKRIRDVLELVEVFGYEDRNVNELSRGIQQRICLARAMLHTPKLLLMDEPTLGLDPNAKRTLRHVMRNLCQEGYSVLVSSHDLIDLADMCSMFGIIKQGSMFFQGEIDELMLSMDSSNPILITVFQNLENAIRVLRNNPLVTKLSIDKNRISILFSGSKEEEALLMKELLMADVLLSSFRREYNDLETLFFHMTGTNLEQT